MDILYAVCSWGLGHATRSLPVIRRLVEEGHDLTLVSHDRSLKVLEHELGEKVQRYVDIPDYPVLAGGSGMAVMAKSLVYWPKFAKGMVGGHREIKRLGEKKSFDCVMSDGRYDGFLGDVPSFFISHQMRIMNPLRMGWLEDASERFNEYLFKYFKGVIVPDFEEDGGLSGDLGHNLAFLDDSRLHYVGVLSDFRHRRLKKDIDYLISITGPEPYRSTLEKKLLEQAQELPGEVVMTLGKSETMDEAYVGKVKTFSFLSASDRERLLNRSRVVVSRSGYSTILDLAVIGCKALFMPTPGQIEQEYLGEYHRNKGYFYCVDESDADLSRDVRCAGGYKGIDRRCDVSESVDRVLEVISEGC